jgi:transglutaminase-like putative cysteine protease
MSGERQYLVRHTSRFAYSAPISESMMEVRMQPRSDGRQRCLRFELTTQPRARVFAYQDSLGNVVHHFDIPSRHARLWVTADAVVEMAPMPELPESLPETAWDELDGIAATGERWHTLQESQFARKTPLLAELASELALQRDADPLTLMRRLNYALFHTFTYAQSETKVDSPIDVALKARAGVCQDLAHIMIALARGIGVPCRYVSGYLSPGTETVGRDYADVPPTRGVFRGEAGSVLAVRVTVSLADTPIRPERVMPMTTWVAAEVAEPSESFDQAQQQQQQQQQQQ